MASPRKRARTALPVKSTQAKTRPSAVTSPAAPLLKTPGSHWTFLTNHSHVLLILSREPSPILRKVALQVGITERAVQRIIADLESGGIIERDKVGRQNQYRILVDKPLRHKVASHRTIGDLLALINDGQK